MVSKPGLRERVAGVHAAVVELDALADPVRARRRGSTTLRLVGADRLVLVLVGRVEVRASRASNSAAQVSIVLKTGTTPSSRRRARTVVLADAHACARARGPTGRAAWPRAAPRARRSPSAPPAKRLLRLDHPPHAVQEPRVDPRVRGDLVDVMPGEERAAQVEEALRRRLLELRERAPRAAAAPRPSSRPSRPISSERIALPSASANVRPIAIASPTDFIWIVRRASARGNFSKVQRGILTTT